MQVFRLVNDKYDPIEISNVLSRTSDHSNQKIAEGMYFALTREDALEFSRKNHGHAYTHLLTCRIEGVSKDDLVDLIADPNLFVRLNVTTNSPLNGLKGRELHTKYCEIHRKKGILWKAANGWTELCLLKAHATNSVIIEAAEALK
jgi:hypothetical protein